MKLIQGDYRKIKMYLKKEMKEGEYFEFKLPYVDENCVFREINRFNDESRRMTRFKNKYTGNVSVDISDWAEKDTNEYFEAFAYFLLDRVLEFESSEVVLTCEKECKQKFLSILEECFLEEICVTDLGVRHKAKEKRVIGFVPDDSDTNNPDVNKEGFRNV